MIFRPRGSTQPRHRRAPDSRSRAAGAQLVALPEYFPLIGASDGDRLAARERDGSGPIQDFLAEAAARAWHLAGRRFDSAASPTTRPSCATAAWC
jgi:predicted amidohydrolase